MDRKRSFIGRSRTVDVERRVAHLRAVVERNKTRRGRDEPPAAMPMPVEPKPRGGGLSGGAAAALTFDREDLA